MRLLESRARAPGPESTCPGTGRLAWIRPRRRWLAARHRARRGAVTQHGVEAVLAELLRSLDALATGRTARKRATKACARLGTVVAPARARGSRGPRGPERVSRRLHTRRGRRRQRVLQRHPGQTGRTIAGASRRRRSIRPARPGRPIRVRAIGQRRIAASRSRKTPCRALRRSPAGRCRNRRREHRGPVSGNRDRLREVRSAWATLVATSDTTRIAGVHARCRISARPGAGRGS